MIGGFLGAADSYAAGMADFVDLKRKCVTERLSQGIAQVGDSQMLRARELVKPGAPSMEGCTVMVLDFTRFLPKPERRVDLFGGHCQTVRFSSAGESWYLYLDGACPNNRSLAAIS